MGKDQGGGHEILIDITYIHTHTYTDIHTKIIHNDFRTTGAQEEGIGTAEATTGACVWVCIYRWERVSV